MLFLFAGAFYVKNAANPKTLIGEKLIFRANVELVAPNSLPKLEYKAKLVRKLYEEKS